MSLDHNSEGHPSQEARFNSCLRYVDAFAQQLYFFFRCVKITGLVDDSKCHAMLLKFGLD